MERGIGIIEHPLAGSEGVISGCVDGEYLSLGRLVEHSLGRNGLGYVVG